MRLRTKAVALVVGLMAVIGFGVYEAAQRAVARILEQDLVLDGEHDAMDAERALRADFAARNERRLIGALDDLVKRTEAIHAVAMDADGTVLAHSDVVDHDPPVDDFTRRALDAREPVSRMVTAHGKPAIEISVPVWRQETREEAAERFVVAGSRRQAGEQLGIVRVAIPLQPVYDMERRIGMAVAVIVLVAGGVALLLTLIAIAGVSARLGRLTAGVTRVADGQHGATVQDCGSDELGELAERFNAMSQTLARTTVSKQYLANILGSTQDALFVTDAAGRVALANPAALSLVGREESRVLGRPLVEFLVDEGGSASRSDLDVTLLASDGRRIPVLLSTSGLRDADGMVSGLVCVAKDITERKRAEGELAFRNALLQAQQETSLDGILVVDAQHRIQAYNRRFMELWGIPQDVLDSGFDERSIQAGMSRLKGPEAFVRDVKRIYAARDKTSQDELEFLDGRVVERYSSPIASDGKYYGRVWYFRDVTDRKQAEEAKALRERDLILREFVANVSHELRTPITAIKGFAETLLIAALDDPENRRGFVETIERNADRLARLVDNLLTLSVLDSGRKKPLLEDVDLEDFVREFAHSFEPLVLRAGLSLKLSVPTELHVLADRDQLGQVLQNLIDNAIKFNKPGGTVAVSAVPREGRAVLTVADQGMGIPADDLARVFERFHRADGRARAVKGTGLGLAIAKQIVELHGGRIWAESSEGAGASFHFTLPLADVGAALPLVE